ncbi:MITOCHONDRIAL UNCOUPLING PROTEIN 5-LIKE [Salix purpurea]|uniref:MITOCHONDRIAL UNCOUPLING PROTEIN 5-LIKE n=1 Tax=Salix purpurea TaxID=77065 RepID=A0A9Q0ZNL5_SALPP|nr:MITOCHONDRIAL UNCOUPLING PROTEIN 5-LIKE [Salix purpurea]
MILLTLINTSQLTSFTFFNSLSKFPFNQTLCLIDISAFENPIGNYNMGLKGFAEGGIASIIAGASTHPLDLIKVRMQLQGESHIPNPSALQSYRPAFSLSSAANISLPTTLDVPPPPRVGPLSIGLRIIQSEGANALFSGVSATMLRQTLYSTTRMGLYDVLKHKWTDPATNNMPLGHKIVAGLIAGAVGAAVGNPADVAMVRMQADGRLPVEQRRNYKSVVDALGQMSKQEGVASLWRGSGLTVNRAMIVTASQLATYDQAKEMILEKGLMNDGIGTHVTASFAAGFVASVASNPIDVIKTRVMNMKAEPGVEPPYKGALDCAKKTVRAEGPMALYKGFIPTISRQGPFTVVLFVTLEQVRKLLKDF